MNQVLDQNQMAQLMDQARSMPTEPAHKPFGEWPMSTRTLVVVIIVALVLLYLLSPIDIIPDIIPIAGWLDDVAVVIVAWRKIQEGLPVTNPDLPQGGMSTNGTGISLSQLDGIDAILRANAAASESNTESLSQHDSDYSSHPY